MLVHLYVNLTGHSVPICAAHTSPDVVGEGVLGVVDVHSWLT